MVLQIFNKLEADPDRFDNFCSRRNDRFQTFCVIALFGGGKEAGF
jgi:hypothetical protein